MLFPYPGISPRPVHPPDRTTRPNACRPRTKQRQTKPQRMNERRVHLLKFGNSPTSCTSHPNIGATKRRFQRLKAAIRREGKEKWVFCTRRAQDTYTPDLARPGYASILRILAFLRRFIWADFARTPPPPPLLLPILLYAVTWSVRNASCLLSAGSGKTGRLVQTR